MNDNNNHEMENLLRGCAEAEVQPELHERLRRHLDDFRVRMEQEETPQRENIIMTIMRKTQSRGVRWATASAIIVSVVALLVVPGFWSGGQGLAFADVIEKLRQFRPYSCKYTIERHGTRIYSKEIMRDSRTRRREIMEDGSIYIYDLGLEPIRMLTLYPDKKLAIEKVFTDSKPTQDPDLLEIVSNIRESDAENLGIKEIAGKKVQGFHRPDENNDFTIWVDLETGLPIEIDLLHVKSDQRIIMTDFDFKTPLDESLFSTIAPKGYTVRTSKSLLNPAPETIKEFKPYSCRQTVERNGKIVSETQILRLDSSHSRMIEGDEIAVSDLSGEHPLYMELKPAEMTAVITTLAFLKGPMEDPDLVAMSERTRDGSEEDLGEKVIDGQAAEGFRTTSPGNEITFWLDKESKLPLRIEIYHTLAKQKIVMDKFDFNCDFDESLFKIEAPEGYTVEAKEKLKP